MDTDLLEPQYASVLGLDSGSKKLSRTAYLPWTSSRVHECDSYSC